MRFTAPKKPGAGMASKMRFEGFFYHAIKSSSLSPDKNA
jgi:hypothetical protein